MSDEQKPSEAETLKFKILVRAMSEADREANEKFNAVLDQCRAANLAYRDVLFRQGKTTEAMAVVKVIHEILAEKKVDMLTASLALTLLVEGVFAQVFGRMAIKE